MLLKVVFFSGLIALALSSLGSAAAVSAPLWDCSLQSTSVSGWTAAVGLSVSDVHGTGVVHCQSLIGPNEVDTPVVVALVGVGAGLGYARVDSMNVYTAAVGVATPNDLFGTFKLQGDVSGMFFGDGADAETYVGVNDIGLSAGVGFSDYRGYGLDVNAELEGVSIRPVSASSSAPVPPPVVVQK